MKARAHRPAQTDLDSLSFRFVLTLKPFCHLSAPTSPLSPPPPPTLICGCLIDRIRARFDCDQRDLTAANTYAHTYTHTTTATRRLAERGGNAAPHRYGAIVATDVIPEHRNRVRHFCICVTFGGTIAQHNDHPNLRRTL
jgi:hypothetical protein